MFLKDGGGLFDFWYKVQYNIPNLVEILTKKNLS